jgi:hypothetical protein
LPDSSRSRARTSEVALQFAVNTAFVFLCHVNTGIVREQQYVPDIAEASILVHGRNLDAPMLLFFLGIEISPTTKTSVFSISDKRINLFNKNFEFLTLQNHVLLYQFIRRVGRAIAEAVSRWFPTEAARVRARVW